MRCEQQRDEPLPGVSDSGRDREKILRLAIVDLTTRKVAASWFPSLSDEERGASDARAVYIRASACSVFF